MLCGRIDPAANGHATGTRDGRVFVREMASGVELSLGREAAELDCFWSRFVSVPDRVFERHVQRDGSRHHGGEQPDEGDSGGEESAGVHE